MFDWEGRILDNKSIMVVKAALPFLDIPVGEIVDMEGLLRAIRNFCYQREQKLIDMLLNFFMMKRMMSVMSMMNEAQNTGQGMEGMFEILKSQIPKEQQEMFDMMSMMMSMSEMSDGEADRSGDEETESASDVSQEEFPEEEEADAGADAQSLPEIWRSIVENIDEEQSNGRPE